MQNILLMNTNYYLFRELSQVGPKVTMYILINKKYTLSPAYSGNTNHRAHVDFGKNYPGF